MNTDKLYWIEKIVYTYGKDGTPDCIPLMHNIKTLDDAIIKFDKCVVENKNKDILINLYCYDRKYSTDELIKQN